MPVISFDCPDELVVKLDSYAEKKDRKRSDIIRLILREKLK